ncbi:MAG: hypothetical protein JWQ73_597, partial [Variovorax sp.]|nr:hypothetical protein [Variovorax sp.]
AGSANTATATTAPTGGAPTAEVTRIFMNSVGSGALPPDDLH